MSAAQILHTIVKFYTTEVQLKCPTAENDWANYALSYLQHFTGKDVIRSQDGKIERVDPKTVEEKYPWIPSAIKSVAYFCLMIPFAIIGTVARALSLDSTEVTEAIFSEKCPPPRREPPEPAMPKVNRPAFGLASTRKSRKISFRLPKDVDLSSAPSSEQKTRNSAWNTLVQFGEGIKGEAAALYQEMQALGPEKFKLQKQAEASQMLGLLLSFNKELLKHAQNPSTSTPNYAAVVTFIEEQRRNTQNYCFPFFLRDYFIMSLPTMTLLGVKLNSQDSAQWEELDAECQVLMNTPELKTYLNEESPSEMQDLITANQQVMRSQALPLKAQSQDMMKKQAEFFKQLLVQLGKKPQDRSAILSLLNAKGDKLSLGAEAFTFAKIYKAESRVLKNFYDEPLFSNYIELYTSCFVQLHTAKFTMPSTDNPLSKDLLEGTAPAVPIPSPATPAAKPAVGSNLQNDEGFNLLLQSAISFSEEFLRQKSIDDMKVFIENNRKATGTYKSPFNIRCYVIFTLRTFIETNVPLNRTDVDRWRKLDEKLEIVMQNPKLKPYLDEEAAPEFKLSNAKLFEQIRTSFVQNRVSSEQNFLQNTFCFQLILDLLGQIPLQRNIIEISLGAERDKVAAVFFEAKGLLAARGFTKDLFVGELYENYFNAYIACITRLQALKFEIPFFSISSLPAEPNKAAPAPITPALPATQITQMNQELKTVTDFYEELLAISPDGTGEWLDAQKLKPDYCYPFHWSKAHAETLKLHRGSLDQTHLKKWEKLYPKCIARLEEHKLATYLDESPESPGECKQS